MTDRTLPQPDAQHRLTLPYSDAWAVTADHGDDATTSVHVGAYTGRDGASFALLTVVEAEPDDGDDTPDGYAEARMTLDALRALHVAIGETLAALDGAQ